MFVRNEGSFYKQTKKLEKHIGRLPSIDKFTDFWAGIWEDDSKTPVTKWMKEIEKRLREKVKTISEFKVTEQDLQDVVKKRKNWSAPGIDGITNYWWKTLTAARKPLARAMQKWVDDNTTIPQWIALGRTVLLPKAKDLSSEEEYRPITCLNTSYKLFTGILAKFMKEHAEENDIWDRNQMGTCQDVLGTVDQLLIDNCIMEEVRTHKRNLAVAYYDYRKAYDMVHHDWMLRVYEWMGIPKAICKVIEQLIKRWKTRLKVFDQGKKVFSRWIEIKRGFLQGDSYSPVGFCLTEIPIAMLLEGTEGYKMGPPGNREVIRTHSLFIDDLKVYQENHAKLEIANETIVQASLDTGACYGVKKCAEIVFKRGKMIKGEGLSVLEEKMKALDPEQREIYKFLGCEQAEKIDMERVMERVKAETEKRTNVLVQQELYDKNLIKAINRTVIPVAGYVMNVCTFTKQKLDELDKAIKKILRDNKIHGKQASDERLYMRRENGGRGLKV